MWHVVEEVDAETGRMWWAIYDTQVGCVAPYVLDKKYALKIATTPDMMEALEELTTARGGFIAKGAMDRAKAALAKARGE